MVKSFPILALAFGLTLLGHASEKPNILYIAIDDLRPELGCYGSDIAITPNLDALAGDGLLFERAYVQQAICGPSRASIMTGGRPDTTGVTHNYLEFRDLKPDIVTLPQHFRENGYETAFAGKIFHGKKTDDEKSWSKKLAQVDLKKPTGYALPENLKLRTDNRAAMTAKYGEQAKYGLGNGPAYESADVPDHTYVDGYNTRRAIATMEVMANDEDKPFFMALGFKLPHLNWVAPTRYWDLYDRDKIPMATQVHAPVDGSAMGLHPSFELRVRHGIPKSGPIGEELGRTLKHAYLACVSYVDAQVGLMIKALEEAGERENTIIIVWSDHGWHLGDMGVWGKATNYEITTRIPMIIWSPDMPAESRGQKSKALVEAIDMYPSLCELAGLPLPEHLEGLSFKPLLTHPHLDWKRAAFSQFPSPALREWGSIALRPGMRETYFGPLVTEMEKRIEKQHPKIWNRQFFEEDVTGYAMRTDRHRLILWKDTENPEKDPFFIELYDHQDDPGETRNIAAANPALVQELLAQFDGGWEAALPDRGN